MVTCKKCGAELMKGACFCMKCGTKIETEVICSKCGTKLPQGALFCYKCGTSVGSEPQKEESIEIVRDINDAFKKKTYPIAHVSNKGNMVYVEGKGLYYLESDDCENRLLFLPCGQKKPRVIVRKQNGALIFGLGYYHGEVFFWRENDGKYHDYLAAISIETDEIREVLQPASYKLDVKFDGYKKDKVAYQNGRYYQIRIGHSDSLPLLRCYDIEKSIFVDKPLPDLRSNAMPENWFKPVGPIDRDNYDEWSYGAGADYYGKEDGCFTVRDDYGFLSLGSGRGLACSIRFLLSNPADFMFFPMDTCSASDGIGRLFQYENVILYCGLAWNDDGGMYRIEVDTNSIKRLMSSEQYKKFGEKYRRSSWIQGSKVFFGNHFYDIKEDKFYNSPVNIGDSWSFKYVEDENGGVYLLDDRFSKVYYMPKNWYMANSQIDFYEFEVFSQN